MPTDDRRPAAEAGRADDGGGDVYRVAAEAYCAGDVPFDLISQATAEDPQFRAAIDAVRAPLLAALGGTRQMLDVMVNGENTTLDGLRAQLAEVTRERDDWKKRAHDAWDKGDQDAIERITLVRERDEAQAKAVDGGEWQWGVRLSETGEFWHGDETFARLDVAKYAGSGAQLLRRWVGPVEPVTDDEAAP